MTIFKNIRLGLLHVALAITFVAINGVLNRIMIHDLGITATLVAILVVVPYVLSPAQVFIGQYSDTHPVMGYRRTPYILLGMALAFSGMVLTPYAALMIADQLVPGVLLGLVAFGLWGVGYNVAVVSYLSLASDLSTDKQRSRTIAVMWFMMILSIIISAIVIGRALEPYSTGQLFAVFRIAALVGVVLTLVAVIGLEPRRTDIVKQKRESQKAALNAIVNNPQARLFFVYLILMLSAILGQDVLLEPFGAHAFNMTVEETTQLTATWGGMTLISLLLTGFVLNRLLSKKEGAFLGGLIATIGLLVIASSGSFNNEALFVPGIAILGFGTGIATATNLGLMLDMTTAEQAGLFIGAWGVADALARGLGILLGGVIRDVVTFTSGSMTTGYVSVFIIEALLLASSLVLLSVLSVDGFREEQPDFVELAAMSADL